MKIPIKIRLYFRDETSTIPRKIEIEMRRNFVIVLPPDYYKKSYVFNPVSGWDMPLRQFPVMKVYKHRPL
jgi:hypothetical protein